MTNHDEQMKAVARLVSGRPDWIDAPAVQAWHRSDGRTEHDGTPGKPRIWSPDYRTTERWSTPSLRNVHWSDLVDVVPLAAPAGSYTRTDEQPRTLTADDITDEMVERARNAPSFDGRLSPSPGLVREMLTAALTEPPARPEGAEEIEAIIADQIGGDVGPATIRNLADRIATEGGAA